MFDVEKIDAILERATYYGWCDAWCSHNERLYEQSNAEYANLAGCRIEDYAPEEPDPLWLADWYREYGGGFMLRAWLTALDVGSMSPVLRACLDIDDTASLGFYLVMEALGHGVSMGDDGGPSWHDIGRALGSELPMIDLPDWFGAPGAEDQEHDAWSWVDGATCAEIARCLDALAYPSGDKLDREMLKNLMRDGGVELDAVSGFFSDLYKDAAEECERLFPSE